MFVEFKEEILRGQSVMVSSIREEIQQVVQHETEQVQKGFQTEIQDMLCYIYLP